MLKNKVEMRLATLKDVEAIITVAHLAWYATYEPILGYDQTHYMYTRIYNVENIENWIKTDEQPFLLLLVDEKVIGFAAISALGLQAYKLNKIYLLPTEQGKGYGKTMLQAAEAEVMRRGGKRLEINVNRYNKALHFYENQGYSKQEEMDIPFGPYFMNDYVLSRWLK